MMSREEVLQAISSHIDQAEQSSLP
jgi:hypothetical protein